MRAIPRFFPEPGRFVLPLAAYLALSSYTATQSDPVGSAEGAFLTLLIAGVLAAIAALGIGRRGIGRRQGSPELALTALLATATVWLAYQGPSRGAVVSLILVIGLAVSAARELLDERGRLRSGNELAPGITVPLALGLQLLMRGDLLLAPLLEVRTTVSLVVLPTLAGIATSVLASGVGRHKAILAGGLVAVLAPGWTMTSTLALAALAAGVLFDDRTRPKVVRWAAVVMLALLPFWSLPEGLLFAVGAMAVTAPSLATASIMLVGVIAVVLLTGQAYHPVLAVRAWVGAVLLVPGAALAAGAGRWQLRLGAILALAAAIVSKAPEAMAVGVAVTALAIPEEGAVATLQRGWCGAMVIGTTLLAAYPWVRHDPRGDLLELFGFDNEVSALLALLLVVAGLGFALDRFRGEFPSGWYRPGLLAFLLLSLGLFGQALSVRSTTVLINSYHPVTFDIGGDKWQQSLPSETVTRVVLDSHLAGGVPIGSGTEAAIVELQAEDGSVLAKWPLRIGYETGEWAVSRPDLAGRGGFSAPDPWISWVAPGGGFFAHRFRSRWTLPASEGPSPHRILVRRGEDLPAETRLSIYRLELRR